MNYPRVGAVRLVHLSLIGLLLVGCGGPSGSYQGVVRFDDGSPVQSGSIELRSLATGSRYASRIASDGSFSLAGQDGELRCPPGNYEAVVVQIVLTEDLAAGAHQHGQTVPRRYADYYTSDLRVTNDSDPASRILITLKSSDQSSD
ncbi:hypothetical protein FHS27_000652 [Rhodopirellula rubra]|uniref:Carboxypeptidase regulatory-like domain-containing protein n=1 Tax=Aporhodopirellula rubra TaxID=980271 RepID=A0A7W5DUN2_9BACT|nr:hypothetical protein [Aporhodopirellula rubra]